MRTPMPILRCLHTRGIPAGTEGTHADGPAQILQGCLRRLLQIFGVVVHTHPNPLPNIMNLHVYFTDLLTVLSLPLSVPNPGTARQF